MTAAESNMLEQAGRAIIAAGPRMVKVAMILPDPEAEGESRWRDDRLPSPFEYGNTGSLLGNYASVGLCERHLFDVVETARDINDDGEPLDDRPDIAFRTNLTCVRCGYIEQWRGTRTSTYSRVDPTPIRCKGFAAQQTSKMNGFARDLSHWTVYADGVTAGVIVWERGPRGRIFFVGRLFAWPRGETVEGTTPIAVLRKISARAAAAEPVAIQAGA